MRRIDEALRRLKGGTPEPRLQPVVVERFPSEGKPNRTDESGKPMRSDEHKVATFVAPPPHAPESRAVSPAPSKVAAPVPRQFVEPKPAAAPPKVESDSEGD